MSKVILITGTSSGFGKSIAEKLHSSGHIVIGTSRNAGNIKSDYLTMSLNINDYEMTKQLIAEIINTHGKIDILINNAGILRDKTLFNMEESDWDIIMAVHLKGHFNCTKPFACYIRETNRLNCRVINMSSVSGLIGNFGQTNYGAAKAGIAGFSRSLSMEMAKYKCTVNTISPGAATRLTIDLMKAAGREVDPNDWSQGPQQIAPIITWICSDEASEITNQIFHVSSGTVGIMQQPAVIKSFKSDELWSMNQLNELMPELVEAKKSHDKEVEKKGEPI